MLASILVFAAPQFTAAFPISPDGSRFIEPYERSAVLRAVDAKTGKKRELRGCKLWPSVIRFSPDGTMVAASNTLGEVCLWAVDSGKLVFKVTDADSGRIPIGSPPPRFDIPLLFSPDSRSLAVGNLRLTPRIQPDIETPPDNGVLSLWDTKTGKRISEVRTANAWPVTHFSFVNEGRTLRVLNSLITDFDLPLVESRRKEWAWQFYAMSNDGSLASDATPDWITVWDVASRKEIVRARGTGDGPIDIPIFAPDNRSFAILRRRIESATGTDVTFTTAELWSYPEGKLLWTAPEARSKTLVFSPDGSTVLLPNLQLRKVTSGEVIRTFKGTELPVIGKGGRWLVLPRKK
jgi:WD40 repeat protein